jgi:hypothetical protein
MGFPPHPRGWFSIIDYRLGYGDEFYVLFPGRHSDWAQKSRGLNIGMIFRRPGCLDETL